MESPSEEDRRLHEALRPTVEEITSRHADERPTADFVPLVHDRVPEGDDETARYQRDSMLAQSVFDEGLTAAKEGDEERAIELLVRASRLAETSREWYIAAVACKRVGDFLMTPSPPVDHEKAFRMYRRAVAAFDKCGLTDEARELSYRISLLRMRRADVSGSPIASRAGLVVAWAVAGFGHRPARVLGCSAVVIVLYAFLYYAAGGIKTDGGPLDLDLVTAVYFSGTTFTTIGFGDLVPDGALRLVALTEGFVGAIMNGLFVAVLATRLAGR